MHSLVFKGEKGCFESNGMFCRKNYLKWRDRTVSSVFLHYLHICIRSISQRLGSFEKVHGEKIYKIFSIPFSSTSTNSAAADPKYHFGGRGGFQKF